jgi:hypothetical protein
MKRPRRTVSTCGFLILLCFSFQYSEAASQLEQQREALDFIAEFADKICKDIPLEGYGNNIELSGKAKADLNGLIKKFADIGIEGAGKYAKSNYQGLLQKDLLNALKNSTNCRLEVFKDLKDKLLTTSDQLQDSAPEPTTGTVKSTGFTLKIKKLLPYHIACHMYDNFKLNQVIEGYKHERIIQGEVYSGNSIEINRKINFDTSITIALVVYVCNTTSSMWISNLTITGEDYKKGPLIRKFGLINNIGNYALEYVVE